MQQTTHNRAAVRLFWQTALFVFLTLGSGVPSWGATFIWNGGGTDGNWSTGGNWTGGGAPVNNGTATIVLAGTNQLAPNVDAAWDISSLTFSNSAGAFVLGGSALNIRNESLNKFSPTGSGPKTL